MQLGDESEVRQVEESPQWHPPVLGLAEKMQIARCGDDGKESFLLSQLRERRKGENIAKNL